jgi:hypothetical protein
VPIHINRFEIEYDKLEPNDAVVLTLDDESTIFLTPAMNVHGEVRTPYDLTVHPADMRPDMRQLFGYAAQQIVDNNSMYLNKWYDRLSHEGKQDKLTELTDHILELPVVIGKVQPGKPLSMYGHCPYPMSGFEAYHLRWISPWPVIDVRIVGDPAELSAARARILEARNSIGL